MLSFRRKRKPERPQTRIEHLRDKYARDAITLEEFEACAAELIELGIDEQTYTIPVSFDAALKSLYRGPIRDMPKAPTFYTGEELPSLPRRRKAPPVMTKPRLYRFPHLDP